MLWVDDGWICGQGEEDGRASSEWMFENDLDSGSGYITRFFLSQGRAAQMSAYLRNAPSI